MPRKSALTFGLLLVGALSAIPILNWTRSRRSADAADRAATGVDGLFAEWKRADSPGCSVGVRQNGAAVFERGYGMANLELGVPITPASVFHVASISKQFTAMSILLLVQAGKLSLDDEVRKHVPEWANRENPVTIRHLLTHTSGLRDVFLLRELAPPRPGDQKMMAELVDILARQRGLNFSPGSEFQYSNSGYVLLASLVQRLSGQSLRMFAEANIFKPLGMAHTHVHDDPGMIVPDRAYGYHRGDAGVQVIPHADLGRLIGTTGLHTTTGDLLVWLENLSAPRVGDPALVAAMQTPTELTGGARSPYGFGLEVGEHRGLRTISHGGGDPGFAAYVIGYPDRRLGVAVLCNLDNIGVGIGELTRRVADVYLWQDAAAPSTTSAETAPRAVTLSAEELAQRAGLYHDPSNDSYGRIFVRNGKLWASEGPAEGDGFELTPVSPTRFVLAGTPIVVEFVPAAAGRPQQTRVTGAGPTPAIMNQVVDTFAPSAAALKEFSGQYRNEDLGVTYTVLLRDGRLVIQIPGRQAVVLEPLVPDKFYGKLVEVVSFSRGPRGDVIAFTVRTTGVRHLNFERQPPRAAPAIRNLHQHPQFRHRSPVTDAETEAFPPGTAVASSVHPRGPWRTP